MSPGKDTCLRWWTRKEGPGEADCVRRRRRGIQKLLEVLGEPDCLVALEATGHYWRNLVAFLVAHDFKVALINPLRTRRFAEEELERTKTDSIDAVGIARFAAQKRPPATALPDQAREDLREMVKLRQRLMADLSERVVQLHRVVDLGFPECKRDMCGSAR